MHRAQDSRPVAPIPRIGDIEAAWTARRYADTVKLIDLVAANRPDTADHYAFYRFTALAHTSPAQMKNEMRSQLARANDSLGAYRRLLGYLVACPGAPTATYGFGLDLVSEALERYGSHVALLKAGARMSAWLGDRSGAVTMQAEAILRAQEDNPQATLHLTVMRRILQAYQALPGRPSRSPA